MTFKTRGRLASPPRLLKAIIDQAGGISCVAKKVNVTRQLVNSWLVRGKVPLNRVGQVAKALDVSAWGLNYLELCTLMQDKYLPWAKVVESYDFPPDVSSDLIDLDPLPKRKAKDA